MFDPILHFHNPDIESGLGREWLETNGIGGFAGSSLLNCNTRKYHGLLVTPIQGLPDKYVLLSSLDESARTSEGEFSLSVHEYPGALHPDGWRHLTAFKSSPVTGFTYRSGRTVLHKDILMPRGKTGILIRYRVAEGSPPVTLRLRPLFAYRNFHQLMRAHPAIRPDTRTCKSGVVFGPYEKMPDCYLQLTSRFVFAPAPDWYRDCIYREESRRGFDNREDLFCPGEFVFSIKPGEAAVFSASTTETAGLEELWKKELSRREQEEAESKGSPAQKALARSAQQFLITHVSGHYSVVAGYHWFLDWGRDAMIALPGLTLAIGRHPECLEVLKTFASYEKKGLIPNFINEEAGDVVYNTVDASLWFGWAVQQYLVATGDYDSVRKNLWEPLKNIYNGYLHGTDFGICTTDNGLVYAGDAGTQLTWMDAMVHGKAVTPRFGHAVEINALWYNFLCLMKELSVRFMDPVQSELGELIPKVAASFTATFWIDSKGYLGDVHCNGILDPAIRPNQIFAVSLPHTALSPEKARSVVETVEQSLLTPFGLRTLAPDDPDYTGHYGGGPESRDAAYHNGTVWPWLLGHFGEALLRTAKKPQEALKKIEAMVANMEPHLLEAGVGTISEVFDGSPPYRPGGCISQAWSVAELLRLYYLIDTSHPKP
ncbi:MAG: amylo-alpha-1,6-glucosidase [Fibrobacterota bacterium]